jgi:hypothetical protein
VRLKTNYSNKGAALALCIQFFNLLRELLYNTDFLSRKRLKALENMEELF